MRIIKKLCAFVLAVSLAGVSGCSVKDSTEPSEHAKKLMIVAHPDDESIFGGAHIKDGGYFIVCLTNGKNAVRNKEFQEILEETGNEGIILSYPDKTKGKRDNWESSKEKIEKTVSRYIGYKNWEVIATHNPDGEYGHIHHKMTNQIVTSVCKSKEQTDVLWYFAPYYKKSKLPKQELTPMDSDSLKRKEEIISIYSSQKKVCDSLSHIFPYEEWVSYNDQNADS